MTIHDLFLLTTMTLATSAASETHAAPVYFAAQGLEQAILQGRHTLRLYYYSDSQSQHSLDLAAQPRAAAAIYPETQGWQELRGLQLRGCVEKVPAGEAWQAGWECFKMKFPFVTGLKPLVERNTLYVLIPDWMRLVDNRQGFGFKQEWVLDA